MSKSLKIMAATAVTSAIIMILLVLGTGFACESMAAESGEKQTYKITVYSGDKGNFDGEKSRVFERGYNESLTINLNDLGLKCDEKYYARGIRPSGHDNDEVGSTVGSTGRVSLTIDQVKGDASYVVAYGIRDSLIPYTVRYIDAASGASLYPDDVFYGMAGDKPVASYRYAEGYTPNALNITGTLKDGNDNIWTFEYTRNTAVQQEEAEDAEDNNADNAAGNAANNAGGNAGANNAAGNNAAGNAGANNAAGNNNAGAANNNAPAQVVDLDDGDTPLADNPDTNQEMTEEQAAGSGSHTPLIISGAVLVLIIAAIAAAIARRRAAEEDDDDEEDDEEEIG